MNEFTLPGYVDVCAACMNVSFILVLSVITLISLFLFSLFFKIVYLNFIVLTLFYTLPSVNFGQFTIKRLEKVRKIVSQMGEKWSIFSWGGVRYIPFHFQDLTVISPTVIILNIRLFCTKYYF